ncbi:hypothetical protein D3C71_1733890 [compost metagenome]
MLMTRSKYCSVARVLTSASAAPCAISTLPPRLWKAVRSVLLMSCNWVSWLMRSAQGPGFCGSRVRLLKAGSRVTKWRTHWSQNTAQYGAVSGAGLAGGVVFMASRFTVGCSGLAPSSPSSVPQMFKPGYCVSPLPILAPKRISLS